MRPLAGPLGAALERVRKANAPPPPESSVLFRMAATAAVMTGVLACESVGELTERGAATAIVMVGIGMLFSYFTRRKPWQWVKVLLAASVVFVFVTFVHQVLTAAHNGELTSIEVPLAGLFTWVQTVHSFDVPARRDLLFSLASATALVAIAGAQAVSEGFLVFVAAWFLFSVVGLNCSWRSAAGESRPLSPGVLAASLLTSVVVALGLLVVLPQPRASQSLSLPASVTSYIPLAGNGLVGGAGNPTAPAKAGHAGGRIGVGGYLGFAGPLDTADRLSLSSQVVMRVRATTPGYFVGMTYDVWNGQSWLQSRAERGGTRLSTGSPFAIPGPQVVGRGPRTNIQTFYVEQPMANLLFATANPVEVYFPARSLVLGHDGSIRSTVAMTPGTVYTVVSADDEVAPAVLARDRRHLDRRLRRLPEVRAALALPHRYPRVEALASSIVSGAHASGEEAKVQALEAWMGRNTQYSTAIPPLSPGEDAVSEFLFHSRKGYCEQISTALAVMLRTLGIPARETIGYVPGPFDPLSDTYEIQAKDAHAWVQVFFPGYGWQNFDPTAQVPLAPSSPGSALVREAARSLARLPWTPVGAVAGAGALGYGGLLGARRRRRRPRSFAGRAARRMERLARRAGLAWRRGETLDELGRRLEARYPGSGAAGAAALLEQLAYSEPGAASPRDPSPEQERAVRASLRSLARSTRLGARLRAGRRPGSARR